MFRRGGEGWDMFFHAKNKIKTETPKTKTKNQFLFSSFCPYKYLQKDSPLPHQKLKKRRGGACGNKGRGKAEGGGQGLRRGRRGQSSVLVAPPPLCLPLLGARTLQHTQVIVLFGRT